MRKPLDYYLSLKYPVLLVAEPEGGYTALHADLEGCVSVGDTPEEALARNRLRTQGRDSPSLQKALVRRFQGHLEAGTSRRGNPRKGPACVSLD